MKKKLAYLFVILFWLGVSSVFGQITVTHFNADWNDANKVPWVKKLTDCNIAYVDIVKNPKLQQKNKVVVVPTIIIYKDGEEVERFQADISFKMVATREEIQEIIDELIMSDF
jgi:hypothetical protein